MHQKLLAAITPIEYYTATVNAIRDYYRYVLIEDKLRIYNMFSHNDSELLIGEYLIIFNISADSYFRYRTGDLTVNKAGRAVFTVNGLNAILREKGLPKHTKIDFREYQNYFITELASFPNIRRIDFLSFA